MASGEAALHKIRIDDNTKTARLSWVAGSVAVTFYELLWAAPDF